jgi:biopolymer transport protein ExbD
MRVSSRGRRSRWSGAEGEPGMAPMIDVVFLLLIFFLVTIKVTDVLSRLDVLRARGIGIETIPLVHIDVWSDSYTMNKKPVGLEEMDRLLGKLADRGYRSGVVVTCSAESEHARLVSVLDLCEKAGLRDIALMSRDRG